MENGGAARTSRSWASPVGIRIGYGSSELIRGPEQALEYLTGRWPVTNGRYYDLAKLKCAAALERRASAEEAREVFISAAIEAYVFA
ncbi:hypothetical protein REJC140_03358 [Pseudorhizobium endolithicum]|uniref:DUF982 domain-containing protein n=1 Tax=Pseudorhizobium endolithicum TaxID=1191678 RepID=A0ABM8PKE6_9HYPH|nr:DUF982 domain-containing protein [Pseudorhizobium endolithicum]CAD7034765.1 hypothetical protein REJC140_03358 [Pseudorhizobium endolithicum]